METKLYFNNNPPRRFGVKGVEFYLVGRAGLEPATLCLKGRYSTD